MEVMEKITIKCLVINIIVCKEILHLLGQKKLTLVV